MKPFLLLLFAATAVVLGCAAEPGQEPVRVGAGQLLVEPGFEAASYYFRPAAPAGAAASGYAVEFRRAGATGWTQAFEPVSDLPPGVWKGSLFDLVEDTAWEVRVLARDGAEVIAPVAFRTWSSRPAIAKVIDLSRLAIGPEGLVISDQGTPGGWIKYTAPAGWRLERPANGDDPQVAAIIFRGARHVILENVTIVGGQRHAVLVQECDAVRILNCDLSGWGRVGVQQFTNTGTRGKYVDAKGETINYDGAVAIDRSARTVVERCYVHDPRHRANSWMFSHPAGPSAVYVNHARGGTVLRWNDFVGSDEHRWNDVIEARSNAAADGGFFRDSDISGNFLAFGNDDGVELEGGGMNVRFYRNKIEGTTCGISTGPCFIGPQFIYGNLVVNPGDEAGLALMFFKNSHRLEQTGQRHFVGNTLHGPNCSAYGGYGNPGAGSRRLGYMRNNVFVANDARRPGEASQRDDFDHDVYWAGGDRVAAEAFLAGLRGIGQEKHGVAIDPQLASPALGDFRLAVSSPVRGQAVAVPNLARGGADPGAFGETAGEVPFRPLALTAAPRQLDFDAPASVARMQVTLSVPAGAEPMPFAIRKNHVFTWFTVTPAAGTVAPGAPVTLTVTLEPAALHGRPRFKGAFLVRTPTGLSRPVSVYATAGFAEDLRPASAPATIYLDPAGMRGLEGRIQVADEPGVAGGRFVALAGDGSDPELEARFTVSQPGTYGLLMRAAISGAVMNGREFEVALDDGAPFPVSVHPSYQWNTGASNFRAVFLHSLGELTPGSHRLRFKVRAGELKLNELIVTENPAAFFIDEWQRERN